MVFSPEDLTLVKGDPSDRRRFLDDLLVLRTLDWPASAPTTTGCCASATRCSRPPGSPGAAPARAALSTLGVWDAHLATTGAELLEARLALVEQLRPYLGKAYETVARGASRDDAEMEYAPSFELRRRADRADAHRGAAGRAGAPPRRRARPRVSPGRASPRRAPADARQPGRPAAGAGYASHGESWSFALALRLASYDLLRAEGDDPILILDDVFAELDTERRQQLADLVAGAEQVLVTAAVAADVPEALAGVRLPGRATGR